MKKGRMKIVAMLLLLCLLTAYGTEQAAKEDTVTDIEQPASESATEGGNHMDSESWHLSGTVPEELEYITEEYKQPSEHPGTLEKLTYQTWKSFSYEEQTQNLTKEAWVYLPYGYSEEQKYIDNAIENGEIQPLIIVLPTYNNTSGSDSGGLALQLTDRFIMSL